MSKHDKVADIVLENLDTFNTLYLGKGFTVSFKADDYTVVMDINDSKITVSKQETHGF